MQFAQVAHASAESALSPMPPGTNVVVLEARNEAHLRCLAEQLKDFPHTLIRESDSPYEGQVTAIGVIPVADRKLIKRVLSDLPLCGKAMLR